MLTVDSIGGETGRSQAADWRIWLANDPVRTPGLRESYRGTLDGFDQFCLQRGGGATSAGGAFTPARPSVALAREYVELQRHVRVES